MDGELLDSAGLKDLADAAMFMPNVQISDASPVQTFVSIRGIATGRNSAFEQSAGMYVDGVYFSRAE